jgi:hypothetical protein
VAPLATLLAGAKYLEQCGCAMRLPADYYFRYDRRNGSLETKAAERSTVDQKMETGWAAAKVGSYTPPHEKKLIRADEEWLEKSLEQSHRAPALLEIFRSGQQRRERGHGLLFTNAVTSQAAEHRRETCGEQIFAGTCCTPRCVCRIILQAALRDLSPRASRAPGFIHEEPCDDEYDEQQPNQGWKAGATWASLHF